MSDIDDIQTSATENVEIPALGEVLAEARLAKKLTQKDASDFLRYSVAQINALENNQLDALPQAMITRGFIRNYARYLSLDAEPLLASYKLRMPNTVPNTVHVGKSDRQVMLTKESQPWLKYILGSIVVLLFLLTWLISVEFLPRDFFGGKASDVDVGLVQNTVNALPPMDSAAVMTENPAVLDGTTDGSAVNSGEAESAEALPTDALNQDGSQNNPSTFQSVNALTATTTKVEALVGETSANAGSSNVAAAANATSQPSASLSPAKSTIANSATAVSATTVSKSGVNTTNIAMPVNRAAVSPLATVVKEAANAKVEKTVPVLASANTVTSVNTAIVANAPTKAPAEKLANNQQLNLSFSEQTWVQVTDKSGAIVYERVLAAGAQESIAGTKPLNVIIGNAKATKLSFMGKSIDLKPYTTENNVARVRLE